MGIGKLIAKAATKAAAPKQPVKAALKDSWDEFVTEGVPRKPEYKGREKVVQMKIDDFLRMAKKDAVDAEKQKTVEGVRATKTKFSSVPQLFLDDVDGAMKVVGHEGRHRARQLKKEGFDTIPVRVKGNIRWSEQADINRFDYRESWPSKVIAEDGDYDLPMFPREKSTSEYGDFVWEALNDIETKEFNKGGAVTQTEQMLARGGFATGGMNKDPVSGNDVPVGSLPHEVRDDVDAKLSEGEFVLPADVVRFIGLDRLMKMRDKAKEGLQRMNEMGQMGNSDEAKMNGEDPLGQFDGEDEDDEGFEAEIDDIMGSNVEMATGGDVPGTTTITGQNTGGSNSWLWQPTEKNTRFFGYDPATGKWGSGTESFMTTTRIEPEIEKYLRAIGYTGKLQNEDAFKQYAAATTPGGLEGSAYAPAAGRSAAEARDNALTSGWKPDETVWNPNERNTELDKFLADKGLKLEAGVHQVPNASQKTVIQRLVGADGAPVAVDAFNDRYDASNRWSDFTKAAILAMGGAALAGVGTPAAAGGGTSTLSPTLTGATPTVTTGSIAPGTAGLTGGAPIVSTPGVAGFGGGLGGAEIAAMPAGLSGGTISAGTAGLTGGAPLVATPGVAGFGGAAMGGAELAALPATIGGEGLTLGGVLTGVGKEVGKGLAVGVAKDALLGGGSGGGGGMIPGLIAGGAIGSALAGGSDSPSTPTADAIKAGRGGSGGNNPVVDYRPVDGQMEELFINNRPTGKKKKRGMATGGDVLSNYDFFKDA